MPEQGEKIFSAEELAVITAVVKQHSEATEKRIKDINWLMGAVVIVLFVGFAAMFVAVAALIIDSSRLSSITCREYSVKIETYNTLLETVTQNQKAIQDLAKRSNDK